MKKLFIILILSVFLSGCTTKYVTGPISGKKYYYDYVFTDPFNIKKYAEEYRQHYIQIHPDLTQQIKNCILNKKICIGMTKEDVIASWGTPKDINKSVGSWGVHEQWIYGNPLYGAQYLYFENGKLTSWQD